MLHVSQEQATNCTSSIVYRTTGISDSFIDNLVQTNLQPLMQALADVDKFLEGLQPEIAHIAGGMVATAGVPRGIEKDDLAQEGLLAVWQCTQRFDAEKTTSEGAFKGYCLQRARGAMHDYIRSHYRHGGHGIGIDDEQWLTLPAQAEPSTKVTPVRERKRINTALNKLTRLERLAIKAEYGLCQNVVGQGASTYMTPQTVQKFFRNQQAYMGARRRAIKQLAIHLQPAAAAR